MDIQRSVIIGAIIVVLYLLVLQWRDFKDAHAPIQAPISEFQKNATPTTNVDNQASLVNKNAATDVPELATTEKPLKKEPESTINHNNYVRVTTDVFDLYLDTQGGDIVALSLPQHSASIETPNIPFTLLTNDAQETYIAQSGLIGKDGTDTLENRPNFSVDKANFKLDDAQQELVVDLYIEQKPGVKITKRFHFKRNDYLINVEYLINNESTNRWEANLIAQIKRDSKQPVADSKNTGIQPFLGAALKTNEKLYNKFTFEDTKEKIFKEIVHGGWIAMVQHYFVTAWIPDQGQDHTYNLRKVSDKDLYIFGLTSGATVVEPGKTASIKLSYYAGPKDQYRLRKISEGLDLTVDYGWLWFVAQPLFSLLTFYATGILHLPFDKTMKLFSGTGNWGVTIILLTITVKAAFFRLSAASYRSMANMKRLQPKMLELKERYGDNRQKMSEETMKLYKNEKVNPLGGCLPILVQMPVFIALYWVLLESVELRHAPFVGYIKDLSVMDPFFIMPIIMGATMFIQQKLNPPPPDPTQAKVMQMMPIMFTFFFLWFPAGLVLYWIVNNTLSILQQWIITRHLESEKK